jgi:hypothetical protein
MAAVIGPSIAAALGFSSASQATTFSNQSAWNGSDTIQTFGENGTISYGELFTAPGGSLQSFSFLISTGSEAGNAQFYVAPNIAPPNEFALAGTPIYSSGPVALGSSGFSWYTFNGIDVPLPAGSQYIALLTIAGVSDPIWTSTWAGTDNNGGLGGEFIYNGDSDPFDGGSWLPWVPTDAVFEAKFADAATTPVPPALPLFASALGVLGFAGWRRLAIYGPGMSSAR